MQNVTDLSLMDYNPTDQTEEKTPAMPRCSIPKDSAPVNMVVHQQTLLRLLGAPGGSRAPGAQECWDSIRPSRNDQKCHFSVRSSQESHDLSGPFHKWLGGHGSPRLHIIVALLELLEWVCFQACSGVLILSQHISTHHPILMEVIIRS